MVHCLAVVFICICLWRFGCMFLSVYRIVGEFVRDAFPQVCIYIRLLFCLRRIIVGGRAALRASPF